MMTNVARYRMKLVQNQCKILVSVLRGRYANNMLQRLYTHICSYYNLSWKHPLYTCNGYLSLSRIEKGMKAKVKKLKTRLIVQKHHPEHLYAVR